MPCEAQSATGDYVMIDLIDPNAAVLSASIQQALTIAMAIVSCASMVAALTPTPRDDTFFGQAYRVLEVLAFNFGRAKETPPNKDGGRFTAD
jgi:hypothetical protein